MSDTTPTEEKATAPRPLNRWGIGTLTVIQIIAAFLILIAVNYLASQYQKVADFSRASDFTLASNTQGLIHSSQIQSRTKPIKIILSLRRSHPFYDRICTLAEEYARQSNKKISIERLDPVRDVNRTIQLTQFYKISEAINILTRQDTIVVDARPDPSTPPQKPEEFAHISFLPVEKTIIYDNDGGKKSRHPTAFQGEQAITHHIIRTIEGKPRYMHFLTDKTDLNIEVNTGAWPTLRDTLLTQNILPIPVKISELTTIPEESNGLIIAAPRYDFTDAEMQTLKEYWARPSATMLIILRAKDTPEKLRAFLREHGVTPRKDIIITSKKNSIVTTVDATFTQGVPYLQDYWDKSTSFDGSTSSLEIRENAEDLVNRRIAPLSLIQAVQGYWGETEMNLGTPSFDPTRDHQAPLHIAASVIKGSSTEDADASQVSRMIVIANTDFLQPHAIRDENLDFLASSANWLAGRDEITGRGPRRIITYKLPILRTQADFINKLNHYFLPAALLLISLFIWNARRS